MRAWRLWLRWSWRDLRDRWLLVAAIALTIALGTGVFAGLGSTATWRREANDASYAQLAVADLRVRLATGSFAAAGQLRDALGAMGHPGWVAVAEERLVLPTQVDASTQARTIIVPGRVIGVEVSRSGPNVDRLGIEGGRTLGPTDDGRPVGLLEYHFARHYALAAEGRIRLGGGVDLDYVGQAFYPEYFLVIGERGTMMAEADFAAVFVPLGTAQAFTGHAGQVNDLVLRLAPGVDPAGARSEVERAVTARLAALGPTVLTDADDPAYRILYQDIDNDQQLWNVFAVLILAGAAFAAFNLTSRIVEAQRRQLGIAMALGLPSRSIAIRPLLVGAQIALLGVAFGVVVGLLVGEAMRRTLEDLLPLPVWSAPFQPVVFLQGGLLGFAIPFLASAYPVWRAVRVMPVEAIRTGHLAARAGFAPAARWLKVPGGTFARLPFRNVLRTPRRSLLTALGIASAVTVLTCTMAMTDTFLATVDRGEAEILKAGSDRALVELTGFQPAAAVSAEVGRAEPGATIEPGLRLVGSIRSAAGQIDVVLDLLDLAGGSWRPTLERGSGDPSARGIILSEKAMADLHLQVGDTAVLRHPQREGPAAFEMIDSNVTVTGVHPNPLRFAAYADLAAAESMGLAGLTNVAVVRPGPGRSLDDLRHALFGLPNVASAQAVGAAAKVYRDLIDEFIGILAVIQIAVFALALLIAFNSATISADERAREHATMFAFGTRLRSVLGVSVVEHMLIGLIGTLVGLALGRLALQWIVDVLMPNVAPDIGLAISISNGTVVAAFFMGVLVVGLAPLLTMRRLIRMDLPATLRVVE